MKKSERIDSTKTSSKLTMDHLRKRIRSFFERIRIRKASRHFEVHAVASVQSSIQYMMTKTGQGATPRFDDETQQYSYTGSVCMAFHTSTCPRSFRQTRLNPQLQSYAHGTSLQMRRNTLRRSRGNSQPSAPQTAALNCQTSMPSPT